MEMQSDNRVSTLAVMPLKANATQIARCLWLFSGRIAVDDFKLKYRRAMITLGVDYMEMQSDNRVSALAVKAFVSVGWFVGNSTASNHQRLSATFCGCRKSAVR
jgi:hypothetical protein